MPFTPLHTGPGLAVKALAGDRFSILVFGIAQVAMDIEPLIGLVRGSSVLHGWSHTCLGATLIGLAVFWLAPLLCRRILARWHAELRFYGFDRFCSPEDIGRSAAAWGAFIGTYSHIVLDSIMHGDMTPFFPFSESNGLLGILSIDALYLFCIATGLAGLTAWFIARWRHGAVAPR